MSFTTYANLQTAIQNWAERTDLSSYVVDFITLAESRINKRLRTREMETSTDITVSSNTYALPSDYRGWRRVTALTSPRSRLEFIEPDMAEYLYPDRASGDPKHFTVSTTKITVFPYTTSSINLLYYAAVPALASTDPNWLLTKYPDIYLYASLLELWTFAEDDVEQTKYATLFEKACMDAESADRRDRFARGGAHVAGPTP